MLNHDHDELDYVVQLQIQEVQHLMKGKHQPFDQNDTELAAELYEAELKSYASFISDRALCQSMASAIITDGDVIAEIRQVEALALSDREMAASYGEPGDDDDALQARLGHEYFAYRFEDAPIEDELMEKLVALYVDSAHEAPTQALAESSSQGAMRESYKTSSVPKSSTIKRRCISCYSDVSFVNVVRCPCLHEYCRDCITQLFEAATNDESLYPARCCGQEIPLGLNEIFLSPQTVGKYKAKEVEYTTPNRTYCNRATCSTFIPPQFIQDDIATCIRCRHQTCVMCKGPSHPYDCLEDPTTQEVLHMAREQGWRQCHSCRSLVELSTGCNHMTCRCGAQFCYSCGVQWKQCACDQWDEERLVDRAQVIVERNHPGQGLHEELRQNLIQRERQNLVENHECGHGSWLPRQGGFRCEECRDYMPQFIYECRGCQILACRRCRFNRL